MSWDPPVSPLSPQRMGLKTQPKTQPAHREALVQIQIPQEHLGVTPCLTPFNSGG